MKKFRLYYDKDKETPWLQDMANQGWALVDFCAGVYTFAPCEPGEYLYQIDMLKDGDDFDNYRAFMEDSGVEVVQRWFRWVFLRKRAEEGPFVLYTDVESQVQHYTAIKKFFQVLAVVELLCALPNFINAIHLHSLTIGVLCLFILAVAVVFLRMSWKCSWKIEELKKRA